jgi:hypothetical protein
MLELQRMNTGIGCCSLHVNTLHAACTRKVIGTTPATYCIAYTACTGEYIETAVSNMLCYVTRLSQTSGCVETCCSHRIAPTVVSTNTTPSNITDWVQQGRHMTDWVQQ